MARTSRTMAAPRLGATELAQPLGYGVTIQNGDELLFIGGETTGGKATTDVISVTVENGAVVAK